MTENNKEYFSLNFSVNKKSLKKLFAWSIIASILGFMAFKYYSSKKYSYEWTEQNFKEELATKIMQYVIDNPKFTLEYNKEYDCLEYRDTVTKENKDIYEIIMADCPPFDSISTGDSMILGKQFSGSNTLLQQRFEVNSDYFGARSIDKEDYTTYRLFIDFLESDK
ncbi:hypothetical protein K9L97_03345 [Candidatus Woesearchaeota archaeon]|nr:hypothetical protein [Candidatus Woesearchaeota archaeon]